MLISAWWSPHVLSDGQICTAGSRTVQTYPCTGRWGGGRGGHSQSNDQVLACQFFHDASRGPVTRWSSPHHGTQCTSGTVSMSLVQQASASVPLHIHSCRCVGSFFLFFLNVSFFLFFFLYIYMCKQRMYSSLAFVL